MNRRSPSFRPRVEDIAFASAMASGRRGSAPSSPSVMLGLGFRSPTLATGQPRDAANEPPQAVEDSIEGFLTSSSTRSGRSRKRRRPVSGVIGSSTPRRNRAGGAGEDAVSASQKLPVKCTAFMAFRINCAGIVTRFSFASSRRLRSRRFCDVTVKHETHAGRGGVTDLLWCGRRNSGRNAARYPFALSGAAHAAVRWQMPTDNLPRSRREQKQNSSLLALSEPLCGSQLSRRSIRRCGRCCRGHAPHDGTC